MVATKRVDTPESGLFDGLFVELVIECKKTDTPCVFFVVETGEKEREMPLGFIKISVKPKQRISFLQVNDILKEATHYFYEHAEAKAIQSYQAFTKKGNESIFEALNQVTKALGYEWKESERLAQYPQTPYLFQVFYPAIVVDGQMFEYRLESGAKEISPTEFVQYYFSSRSLKNPFSTELYVIDIFRKEFLSQYLELLEKEIDMLKSKLNIIV